MIYSIRYFYFLKIGTTIFQLKNLEVEQDDFGEITPNFLDSIEEKIPSSDTIILFTSTLTISLISLLSDEIAEHFDENSNKFVIPILARFLPKKKDSWVRNWTIYPSRLIPIYNLNKSGIDDVYSVICQKIKQFVIHLNQPAIPTPLFLIFLKTTMYLFSYSHFDGDFAELLANNLSANGINPWIDDNIQYGEKWMDAINKSIRRSRAVLVIMSPEAAKSDYVTFEWSYALGAQIELIPIVIRETPLHPVINSLHYFNFMERRNRNWDALYERINNIIPAN